MRDYSKVSPQFWIGSTGKKIRAAGIECQLVSLYLMTCAHANMLGMYYLPKIYISHECGLTIEGATKGLARACESGFCAYDEASEVVWVYEMASYQIEVQLKVGDKRILGVQNEYNSIPECKHLRAFYEKYQSSFHMLKMREIQAPSKPLASQEQEQEQEQEHEQEQKQEQEQVALRKKRIASKLEDSELQNICRQTWKSYCDAYFSRYGTEPVRNQKVNSQIKNFVKRLSYEDAPFVAAHYLENNTSYYVQRGHSVDCLLSDAEKLRTEWATGESMTATRAKQIDQTQANFSAVNEAMAILEKRT